MSANVNAIMQVRTIMVAASTAAVIVRVSAFCMSTMATNITPYVAGRYRRPL
jgi:hypothetical protein